MGESGGSDPYGFRQIDDALDNYVASADPAEVPLVLAFISALRHEPRTPGIPVSVTGIDVQASFKGAPKTQAFVTWVADHKKRDIIVIRVESLNSLLRGS